MRRFVGRILCMIGLHSWAIEGIIDIHTYIRCERCGKIYTNNNNGG